MASSTSTITVYEQERQKNIERNKSLLAELGLGEARKQFIETHASPREEKKDASGEKIKRRYTKKTFIIDTPRRSARIQGKPVRYSEDFGSDEGEEERKLGKRKYSFYAVDPEEARPKYKNELTTCHFCRKRDRKPKTRCGTCGVKYWVGDCCRGCFEQHFEDEDFDEVMVNKNWVCYCCRKKCPCMECIAGITKGRRYGPRKYKDSPIKDDYSAIMPFSGVPAEQYNLFSPLPLPSFFGYPHSGGMSQFNLPMPTNPFNSLPSPSSPPFSQHAGFSPYPTPSLFAPVQSSSTPSSSSSSTSASHPSNSYNGGFPALHSAFGGGGGGGGNGTCVSPQNIFGMSPLPPPNPHPHSHYMGGGHPYMGNRDANVLDNGAACGYKMAQVIAQITNSPNYNNSNFIHTNFPPPPTPPIINNNPYAASVLKKKRGRKPKGFMFGMHSSESVSSDPMSSSDMIFEPPPLDILPPIKIPLKRGKKPGSYLPALSVEEEALSASMNMTNSEEGLADEETSSEEIEEHEHEQEHDHQELSDSLVEQERRRHKKNTYFDGRRVIISKDRARRIKTEPTTLPPLPNILDSPVLQHQQVSSSAFDDDEYFHRGNEIVDDDDDDDYLNDINSSIFDDLEEYGFVARSKIGKSRDESRDREVIEHDIDGEDEEELADEDDDALDGEDYDERAEASAKSHKKKGKSKRSKKSSKAAGASPLTIKIERGSASKRKQAKPQPLKEESPSNLRRSARPPRASRAFDENYVL